VVEVDYMPPDADGDLTRTEAIANHIAAIIPDGATLQWASAAFLTPC
jgi:hypothetical protein